MTRVRIGIPVRDRADLAASTLEALAAAGGDAQVVVLADGADAGTRAALARHPSAPVLAWEPTRGLAACFNRLVGSGDADVYVLVENGARPGPGWLEHLLAALAADPRHGLAGPSTNQSWNEQRVFAGAGASAHEIAHTARMAAQRYGDSVGYLEPLHSLADFCYAVKREVVEAIGAADEGYGLGPCWEMDYNIRAARAGFRGVWVRGAYVWRSAPAPWQRAEQAAWFDAAKRRYQDHFCELRLRGEKHDYERHCKGEDCPHFAPLERIALRIPLGQQAAAAPPTPPAPPQAPFVPRIENVGQRALVSCLMPTRNRRRYVPAAIAAFLRQDYEPRELVIVDDGDEPIADLVPRDPRIRYVREAQRLSLGFKRNLACSLARGEILAHWDDDDWHAPWRLSYQVQELTAHGADLCGLDRLWFYHPAGDRAWRYRYPGGRARWVAGGTFCYRRSLWERHRFADITTGEDTRFVREASFARIVALQRDDFYVARVHADNTSPKHTDGASWQGVASQAIRDLLGDEFEAFCDGATPTTVRNPAAPPAAPCAQRPLVSCIMPTFNRRPFVRLSVERFLEQDYPSKELIVVDDGSDAVGDLVSGVPGAHYLRLSRRHSIGYKRNLACSQAGGEVIVLWDDDDWYAPQRVARQVEPILAGRAQLTGIQSNLVLTVPAGEFWSLSPALHQRMFMGEVYGGTLAFARSVWRAGVRYPDASLAEDAAFLRAALEKGMRLERVPNEELFAYTRHQHNTWSFQVGRHVDPLGWARAAAPRCLSAETLAAYREGAQQLACMAAL